MRLTGPLGRQDLFRTTEEGIVMRTFLFIVALLLVSLIGVGFYRGWFQLSSETDNAEHKVHTTLTVDQDKIHADEEKVQALGHKGVQNVKSTAHTP